MLPSADADAPRGRPTGRLGVYVHVPFCVRHCPYCDFAVTVTRTIPHAAYGDAVMRELDARGFRFGGRALQSIYFGGGTPGLWEPGQVARVIAQVVGRFGARALREVTLEVNPDRVDVRHMAALRRAGVTRLSMGVQSFDDNALRALGREHDGARARRAIDDAVRAGFDMISVDLIHGVPGTAIESTLRDIDEVGRHAAVRHVSLYELTWEVGTAFDARRRRGQLSPWPDEALETAWFQLADALRGIGMARYEVSSWARGGARAVHNAAYWVGDEYLGLGVGAHSMRWAADGRGVIRRANTRATRAYLGGAPPADVEHLARVDHLRECIATGLRTVDGADVVGLGERLGLATQAWTALAARWATDGHGVWDGRRFVPNERGLALADTLAATLW